MEPLTSTVSSSIRVSVLRAAEHVADHRLADRAGEDAERRDPHLHGGDDPHGVVHEPQRGPRARAPGLGPGREGAAAGRHDGVLADHEERVGGDEPQHGEDAQQVAHRVRGVRARRPERGTVVVGLLG
jgi:hypothetical protein